MWSYTTTTIPVQDVPDPAAVAAAAVPLARAAVPPEQPMAAVPLARAAVRPEQPMAVVRRGQRAAARRGRAKAVPLAPEMTALRQVQARGDSR
jgi:hypothetical protein